MDTRHLVLRRGPRLRAVWSTPECRSICTATRVLSTPSTWSRKLRVNQAFTRDIL